MVCKNTTISNWSSWSTTLQIRYNIQEMSTQNSFPRTISIALKTLILSTRKWKCTDSLIQINVSFVCLIATSQSCLKDPPEFYLRPLERVPVDSTKPWYCKSRIGVDTLKKFVLDNYYVYSSVLPSMNWRRRGSAYFGWSLCSHQSHWLHPNPTSKLNQYWRGRGPLSLKYAGENTGLQNYLYGTRTVH